jgi:ABC-type antimicrobial peptide transport system permease subunit
MKKRNQKPPRFPKWLLSCLKHFQDYYAISGDLEEGYQELIEERGVEFARFWYWIQTINCLFEYLGNRFLWSIAMFVNHLKVAFRNMLKHKGFSFINIAGLAVGLACVILILIWVNDELSYNRFHENSDRIGRIIMDLDGTQVPASPGPLAQVMIDEFPEVKNAVRYIWGGGIIEYKGKKFEERGVFLVEPSFLEIFTFPFIEGDPKTALNDPGSIVLTEATAKKYFGNKDPMGKTILYSSRVDRSLKVTGILKNIPHNSSLQFDFLTSFEICRNWKEPDSWSASQDYQTYVLVDEKATIDKANQTLDEFCDQYFAQHNIRMFIQPLKRIHLHSNYKFDTGHGDILYVTVFTLIALVVLLIACINYMNLSTARFENRFKEVGMRKVIGSNRFYLIRQFTTEALIYSMISIAIAFFMVELTLPVFRNITGKPLSVNYFDSRLLIAYITLLFLTGLLSGSYPAFFLSSFKPVQIFRKTMFAGKKGKLFRKLLVIFQFSLSIIVISGTLVVSNQLDFMRNKKLGYNKENLLYLRTSSYFSHKYDALKNDLLKSRDILNATVSNDIPTFLNLFTGAEWEGKPEDSKHVGFQTIVVNEDFLETYEMEMADGRFYTSDFPSDMNDAFVVNETAVKTMGIVSPIGKKFSAWEKEGRIIGVVKDFHFKSVKEAIDPLIIHLGQKRRYYQYLTIRIDSENTAKVISFIEKTWEKLFPDYPYEVHFLDQSLDDIYRSEKRIKTIFSAFAFVTIIISCLGLFGLAAFLSEQRTKDIGIRRVLGASISGIVFSLTKDFTQWVLIANVIALPVAFFAMNRWLQNFAYRIHLSIWIFIVSGLVALFIAILTVSYQSIKAATANPVDALKYE